MRWQLRLNYKLFFLVVAMMFFCALTKAETFGEKAGDAGQILIPASAYIGTYIADDTEGRHQFYKSFFSTMGLTYLLKYTIDRDRPEGHGENAFPSGHTAAAFQGAVFIQRRYGWTYGISAYLAASYVGWSRIEAESDKHDALDVCGGALLGSLISCYFTKRYNNVELIPSMNREEYGIEITATW